MTMEHEPLIEAQDVAQFLKVKVSWVKDRTRERCPEDERIPHYRLGSGKGTYTRFRLSEVEVWLARHSREVSDKNGRRGTLAALKVVK